MSIFIVFVEIVLLGLLDFFSFVPFLVRMLFKPIQWLHGEVVSDIPGNPHAFDNVVISLFRTLPEPSNFNIVQTRVPLPIGLGVDEDLLTVKGIYPPSRMHSLSIYGSTVEPPNSMELPTKDGHDQSFSVAIRFRSSQSDVVESKVEHNKLILYAEPHWTHLMIVMRNYLVPPGSAVTTPAIIRSKDSKLLRTSELLVSGPAGQAVDQSKLLKKFIIFLGINLSFGIINFFFLPYNSLTERALLSFLIGCFGLVVAVLLRNLIFAIGKKRMREITSPSKNSLNLISMEKASKSSQPSKLHTYYFMEYEIPDNDHELSIEATIKENNQKYWSLVIYDEYGLPIPQYVFDENCKRSYTFVDKDTYSIDIRMRLVPEFNVISRATVVTLSSKHRKGYALFRLVHPIDDQVRIFSQPSVKLQKIKSKEL